MTERVEFVLGVAQPRDIGEFLLHAIEQREEGVIEIPAGPPQTFKRVVDEYRARRPAGTVECAGEFARAVANGIHEIGDGMFVAGAQRDPASGFGLLMQNEL